MSRFAEPQDPAFREMNTSLGFDRRLWPHDVAQSRAHAKMLAAQGIIGDDDRDAILAGLDQVEGELRDGTFPFEPDDEDIHMAVERRLTEIAGRSGGKVHTARSRNDQVVTDVAMFTREAARTAQAMLDTYLSTLLEAAERHLDWALPGYTHLQRAQPVYLSHHLMAYFWMAVRDRERFAAVERACGVMPLGAGALAGVNFATDRTLVARELGFDSVSPNSIDAVSNRDFILDYLAAAATCATHLSRLGGEIVLWSSSEFGFLVLPDAWSSGSSIMPQKKNPDAGELLRGKAPRIVGHLQALHGVIHSLPLTYNKDLQEDKEHLFDSVDTLRLCLAAATGMVAGARFDRERMSAAASDELIAATDLADLLVKQGTPFRESHGVIAGLVREAVEGGRTLAEVAVPKLGEDAKAVLSQSSWLESKDSFGGTALNRVREQIEHARSLLLSLPPAFYDRPVVEVARDLVGCVLEHDGCAGTIVETEAYHHSEPACHAYVGLTARTSVLFSDPGKAYIYRSYGIHALLNAVCEHREVGAAVLIRAIEPTEGLDRMRARRAVAKDVDVANGPGKLTQALGIDLDLNDTNLFEGPILIHPRETATPPTLIAGPRIGITKAVELPWRFSAAGNRYVSKPWPPGLRATLSPAASPRLTTAAGA